ncbi:polyprenyl synthetase family protein [Flavobacteriaceae bacterium]|nr:polyprenyl synthetase family protein [Flavobacteriaceae bacterium]
MINFQKEQGRSVKKISRILSKVSKIIDKKIIKLFMHKQHRHSKLVDAMLYSSLSKGKKIRPFLVFASASALGVKPLKMLNIAVSLELIHVYSLIHDDLPAMDDDDFRRQQKSCHKKFDEATAILAGDSLLTYAFEILSNNNNIFDAEIRCEIMFIISRAIGFNGMAGGQMLDLDNKNNIIPIEEVIKIQKLKTGKLFAACIECSLIVSKVNEEEKYIFREYINNFGLIFQIKDDIDDYLQAKSLNKEVGEMNIVNLVGLKKAKQKVQEIQHDINIILEKASFKTDLFRELCYL